MLSTFAAKLAEWWNNHSPVDLIWLAVGIVGQLMFTMRWFIQWIASERARKSIVPALFWYFSLLGGLMVLAYGIYKIEPIIILGQFGVFIYARNIYLLWREKDAAANAPPTA